MQRKHSPRDGTYGIFPRVGTKLTPDDGKGWIRRGVEEGKGVGHGKLLGLNSAGNGKAKGTKCRNWDCNTLTAIQPNRQTSDTNHSERALTHGKGTNRSDLKTRSARVPAQALKVTSR